MISLLSSKYRKKELHIMCLFYHTQCLNKHVMQNVYHTNVHKMHVHSNT